MELSVKVAGLSKAYGAVRALDTVDFELRVGEVMALLGENGAGKSTLVKVLAGLVQPDVGRIEVYGEHTDLYPSGRSQAAGIAVVHQEFSTIPTLTVAENLMIGQASAPAVWSTRRIRAAAVPLLEAVGLSHVDPAMEAGELSVAELQLLEIARLLVRDARIIVFDEPTAALSDVEIARVMEVIGRLRAEGRSIIYVTHRLPEVFELADRVTVFRNGQSLPPKPVSDLHVDDVITMMLGREMSDMFPDRSEREGDQDFVEVEGLTAPGLAEPVSLTAGRGQIIGLTGQIGSGADAVLQALAGIRPSHAGSFRLGGTEVRLGSRRSALRAQIAYCSPDRKRNGIFAQRPMLENLSSPWLGRVANLGWVNRQAERKKAVDIGRRFAVDVGRLSSSVFTLSGGNQQKVAVGRWLGTEPQLFLIEEPTRGVDVGARGEIYRSLNELCEQGVTIIVASSDASEILGLADRIGTFYRGRLTALRARKDWTEQDIAREVMHASAAGAARD